MDRFDHALSWLVGAPTFDLTSSVLDELVASGGLSLIRSVDLRRRISSWPRVAAETSDNELVVRDFVAATVIPFLARTGISIGRSFATFQGDAWGLSRGSDADAVTRYRALVADPEFRILATWRYDWALGSTKKYGQAADLAREIVEIIREQLE